MSCCPGVAETLGESHTGGQEHVDIRALSSGHPPVNFQGFFCDNQVRLDLAKKKVERLCNLLYVCFAYINQSIYF